MAAFKHHTQCPKCNSSDAYAVYSDSSGHCFSCGFTKPSDEFLEANQSKQTKKKGKSKLEQALEDKPTTATDRKEKPIVTEEETIELKSRTTVKAPTYRGIRPETMSTFGVRTEFDEASGEPCAIYYPCTQENELTGWKPRVLPKSFGGSIGRTGATCQLFGQFKFTRSSKVCLIVGGENDALSAYQMLADYIKSKAGDYEIAVVSPTIGETGCSKQLAAQYAFFDKYEKIIVGFDNDKAGREATEKVMDVLPKGKVFIANWKYKDPNEYLEKGQERAFISDYFSAKSYVPAGIVASNELGEAMREELMIPKVPLPPFMHKVQALMSGGLPLGRIINLGSASGTGKSTIIDECIYHWIFNSPHRTGIVSLESSKGQYGLKVLSRHVSRKIELMDNVLALEYLDSPDIKQKEHELFNNEDGSPRFTTNC
jgi:Zn ribbon nucleic-acid-binding protein